MTPGERYYRRHGWSGCEGSEWSTLTQAVRDGWDAAARETARHADLTGRLGFGDGITEPQADNDVIVAAVEATRALASEYQEIASPPVSCDACRGRIQAGDDPCPEHNLHDRLNRGDEAYPLQQRIALALETLSWDRPYDTRIAQAQRELRGEA